MVGVRIGVRVEARVEVRVRVSVGFNLLSSIRRESEYIESAAFDAE